MGLLTNSRDSISRVVDRPFSENEPRRTGVYDPSNAGKTILADHIARDWTGDAVGPEGHVPHETCRARWKESVGIERDGKKVTINITDTPGVTTEVDYKELLEHDMERDDAVCRSREATKGVAEVVHWLREDVDGVIYMFDSTKDPISQINTMLIGIVESQDLPVFVFASKIDLENSNAEHIVSVYSQYEAVELSALEEENVGEVHTKIAKYFA